MTKLLIGGALAVLAIGSVAAAAQTAPPPPPGVAQGTASAPLPAPPRAPQMHMTIMSDRVMTRDEVARHVSQLFAKLDSNRDGFITRDEVDALHHKMMGAMGMTHGMAGRFSEGAMPMPDRGAMFDRLDANHDGNISRQEFMAAKPRVREERVMIMRGGPYGAPGGAGMHRMEGMHMHGMGMGMGMGFGGNLFEMADANHDGRVSQAEAQSAALAHFDRADVNHDGRITPDERHQVRQEVRIERRSS
ncbi:EF-hand domain-containing protein [Sphingomonas sp.]|uniref:EF-hand domain-containing protein n=1 Tax=Sphingomonas sp. TaxID=28214 RepID=UPI0038A4F61B